MNIAFNHGRRDRKEDTDVRDNKIFNEGRSGWNLGCLPDYQVCTLSVKLCSEVTKETKATEGITSLKK